MLHLLYVINKTKKVQYVVHLVYEELWQKKYMHAVFILYECRILYST